MNQPPTDPHQPQQPRRIRILKGVLMIVGAFISASLILQIHFPSGH